MAPAPAADGYAFRADEAPAPTLRRLLAERIDRALGALRDETLASETRVHEVRKRMKESRALLRLFRRVLGDVFSEENRRFRDAGRLLAPCATAQRPSKR